MEYLSQEGYNKIAGELNDLAKVKLPAAIQAIAEARENGDLSENYEYRAAKREHGRILGRIRFLQRVLEHARVLNPDRRDDGTVALLSRVELLNLATNSRQAYTLVSTHETNTREGKISIKSPIARALMGHRQGDVVQVRVPAGTVQLRIESISR